MKPYRCLGETIMVIGLWTSGLGASFVVSKLVISFKDNQNKKVIWEEREDYKGDVYNYKVAVPIVSLVEL